MQKYYATKLKKYLNVMLSEPQQKGKQLYYYYTSTSQSERCRTGVWLQCL